MLESTKKEVIQVSVSANVVQARQAAGLSQRDLIERTGLSQSVISRIETGARGPKMDELIALAGATGSTLAEITGDSPVRQRLLCAARADQGSGMHLARRELTFYLELDAYLDDQGVPATA